MIVILSYILLLILFLTVIFFLFRSAIVGFSMLTEVPYLPSNRFFKRAIQYLNIKAGDRVVDIGSGDGRVLFWASKQHPEAQFVGVERNFFLVLFSRIKGKILNRKNLQFEHKNIHNYDIDDFDRIYMYLLPDFIDSILLSKKTRLKKGCTIVSLHYPLGKKFSTINNVTRYPVKYKNREENIYKWMNK